MFIENIYPAIGKNILMNLFDLPKLNAVLIPHILLAALMGPFIITAVIFAFKGKYEIHKKIVKRIWPVWMFVSVSGVIIYFIFID